jgi:serine/threonine protein kinase
MPDLIREIKILALSNHENIVKLYHYYHTPTHLNIVLEYAEDSLFALKQKFRIFKEKEILEVIRQLLRGLHYLHSRGIIHADVKLENIMIANVIKEIM